MEGFQLIGILGDHTARLSDTAHTYDTPNQSFLPIPVSCEKNVSNEIKEQGRAVKLSFDPSAKAATLTPRRRRYKIPATENLPSSAQVEVVPTFKLPFRPNTLPRTCHPSRTSLPVWDIVNESISRPNCQTPNATFASLNTTSSKSPSGKTGSPSPQSRHARTDFSPSNHHPDLMSSLPKEPTQDPGAPRWDLSDQIVAMRVDCDTYVPLNLPLSPGVIASSDVDDATFSEKSLSMSDDTNVDASQYKTVIEQQYDDHQGSFWNSAIHLLEEHYLHPVYLTKAEFVSLVCSTTADISSWFHDNLPAIKYRASKRWMNANYVLRNAGISPSKMDAQFIEAFEFMDDEEQRIFIQSYKSLESHVANAEKDIRLSDQDREHYYLLSLPGKHEFIKGYDRIARQRVDASDVQTRAGYRCSRVESLKAKKAEKLQVLKEKLDEMKQIEQSMRDLEARSSSSSSLDSHYSESADENSPSSDGTAYHEKVSQQNRVSHTHLSFGLTAEADDPFMDSSGIPAKSSLFHEYAIPELNTLQQPHITISNPRSNIKAEVTNKMPYYDGVEYQDYVDDAWLCFEDIPLSPQPMTESNIASRIVKGSALTHTACHTEEASGGSEGELSYKGCSNKVDETKNDEPLPVTKDGTNSKAAERASVMAKLAKLVKLLRVETSYTTAIKSAGETMCQNEDFRTQSSNEDRIVVDESIEKLQQSRDLAKQYSMLSIRSQSSSRSTIEHKSTSGNIVSATRDTDYNGPKSFHVEFLEPVLERHVNNRGDSGENLTSTEPTRRSVRKKMSKFFGSLRRKERAAQ